MKKVCANCGVEFNTDNPRQKFCKRVIETHCKVCGCSITFVCGEFERSTCSKKCMTEYTRMQSITKYGVDNPAKLQSSKDKAKATSLSRYGAESYSQTQEYKDRVESTCLRKYGQPHQLKSADIINKRTKTVQQKYGVDNVFQSESIKEKTLHTLQSTYGVQSNISQNAAIQDKITANNIEKYGVAHPMMLEEYKAKAAETNMKRYGRKSYTQQHISDISKWYEFIANPQNYIDKYYGGKCRSNDIAADLGVDVSTVDVYLSRNNAYDHIQNAKSCMELEIQQFIYSIDPSIRIVTNTQSIIANNELDLYLPDYNLAIECNPTCTHNSSFVDPWGGSPKSHNYHKIKTDKCEEQNIFLFHIFGYEWTNKKDIVTSMIANLLHANTDKIYARKCSIKEVSSADASQFLDKNHRQGRAASKVRLGLYYHEELVALMTFGNMRATIGTGSEDLTSC